MHEKLNELWRRRPFKPFQLKLTNGESYVVRHPEHFMLLKSSFFLGFPKQERFIFQNVSEIEQIEMMASSQAKKKTG